MRVSGHGGVGGCGGVGIGRGQSAHKL
jgi:hypothetical protein